MRTLRQIVKTMPAALIIAGLVLAGSAPFVSAQARWSDVGHDVRAYGKSNIFAAQSRTGQTAFVQVDAHVHALYLLVTGTPAGCTYRLQGSVDGVNFYNIDASDITCTSSIVTFNVDKPAKYIRGNLLTLSGGTAPTVTPQWAGY
jgi:hypothetical protein